MTSNTFSQKDQDFANAMATKLRLNREKISANKTSTIEEKTKSQKDTFRNNMIEEGLEEFPGLTWEEAKKMLDEMGF